MKTKKIRKIEMILLTLIILHSPFSIREVNAAERSFQISPPVVELVVEPGTVKETQITVANLTNDLVTLEAFVRDFVAGTEGDEPKILGEEETSSYSLKNWLLLSQKQFVLKAREEKSVTVTIAAPQNAEAGGHYGLVGFTEPNTEVGEGVGVRAGIATLFFTTVPGLISQEGSISRFTGPDLTMKSTAELVLALKNSGNTHFAPAGTIRIVNLTGQQVAELPINLEERVILPRSERVFHAIWDRAASFGYYQAYATVRITEEGKVLTAGPIGFWMFPLRTVGIAMLALTLLILLLYEFEHVLASRRARTNLAVSDQQKAVR